MKTISKQSAIRLILALSACALFAQNTAVKRTVVKTGDVSVPGREGVIAQIEIATGGTTGRHTHPGDEITYVTEGQGELMVDGRPVQKLKPGEGLIVPGGTIHEARNTGTIPMKLIGVYVVEKGKPLASPAP